jgi:hypothetical protein
MTEASGHLRDFSSETDIYRRYLPIEFARVAGDGDACRYSNGLSELPQGLVATPKCVITPRTPAPAVLRESYATPRLTALLLAPPFPHTTF